MVTVESISRADSLCPCDRPRSSWWWWSWWWCACVWWWAGGGGGVGGLKDICKIPPPPRIPRRMPVLPKRGNGHRRVTEAKFWRRFLRIVIGLNTRITKILHEVSTRRIIQPNILVNKQETFHIRSFH